MRALVDKRIWPESTRAISELRLVIEFESASAWGRMFRAGSPSPSTFGSDYPAIWLLDLPLLGKDYATFFAVRRWNLAALPRPGPILFGSPGAKPTEATDPFARCRPRCGARDLFEKLCRHILKACREDDRGSQHLPRAGRFLMPGADLEGLACPHLRPARRPRWQACAGGFARRH